MRNPFAVVVTVLVALTGFSVPGLGGVEAAGEYEIKAAMYVNLLRLVDWPAGKQVDPAAPLVIGVAGQAEMAGALETLVRSGSIPASRKIVVRRIAGADALRDCASIFVGGRDRKQIDGILRNLASAPVLTVGEDERFIAAGGMVGLILRDDRVQIEVNLDIAQQSGLAISSRLLRIAVVNRGQGK
jgi:hypothetical protein